MCFRWIGLICVIYKEINDNWCVNKFFIIYIEVFIVIFYRIYSISVKNLEKNFCWIYICIIYLYLIS